MVIIQSSFEKRAGADLFYLNHGLARLYSRNGEDLSIAMAKIARADYNRDAVPGDLPSGIPFTHGLKFEVDYLNSHPELPKTFVLLGEKAIDNFRKKSGAIPTSRLEGMMIGVRYDLSAKVVVAVESAF